MVHCWRRAYLAAVLIALLTTAGCSPLLRQYVDPKTGRPLTRAERLFQEGERLAAEGKVTLSILAFRQAHRVDPSYEPALRRLGAAYEAQGRRRLAAYFYELLLDRKPRDVEARQALIALCDALGRTGRADELRQNPGGNAPPQATPAGVPSAAARPDLMWEAFLEEQAISGLAAGAGAIYATTQGGSLFALDSQSGEMRWRFVAPKPIVSRPVYSPGPDGPLVLFGAEDSTLYAISAADGRERWRAGARAPIEGAPAVAGDAVYFGSTDGNLYAAQRSSGAPLWQFATGGPIHAAPLVAGDTVYFGSLDRNVYAVDAATGTERWRFATLTGLESTPAMRGDLLFVGANDSRLYCLNAESGREVWRYSTGDAIYATPMVGEEALYVASASQALFALSPQSGELLWRHDVGTFLTTAPASDGRALYLVASADPQLYALDARSGDLLWALDTGDWPTSEPLLVGETLFLGEKDGTVLAYRLP